jgi:hypothetical protein
MCAKDAENSKCASNDGESAQHTNPSTTSESAKACRLRCNPQRLPEPTIPKPTKKTATSESKRIIRDFFWDKFAKSEKRARERRWI